MMYDAAETAMRINSLLKEKNLSQKDMLEKCELNKNAISSMLSRGSMLRADNLARIADYLECSVDYLLGREAGDPLAETSDPPETAEMLQIWRMLSYADRCETLHMMRYKRDRAEKGSAISTVF